MHAQSTAAPAAPAPIRIVEVRTLALEAPLARSVATPMGSVGSHVSLLVGVRDADGAEGWGEVWCNFPRFGIAHRARLVREVIAPLVKARAFTDPAEARAYLEAATAILRVQSGEPGPIAAAIAGVDIALHDLFARRAGVPLWRMLGGASGVVRAYASLGRAIEARPAIERCLARGLRAFKLHSSGSIADHIATVAPVRELLGESCELMLDVNSSWDPEAAIATVGELERFCLAWLEEPIPADAPFATWRRLARAAPMPLAGGENLLSDAALEAALRAKVLGVIQPDVTKWGGVSGCLAIARRAVAQGLRYCPHMFSGAVGVLASAHVLAASGSTDGMLEFGAGDNPVRDALLEVPVKDGTLDLGDAPGLGLRLEPGRLRDYLVAV
jgi:L-alanine-DL-glutamate epimerase-like enolase superfamily enzyme